jgi:hypothetical protein
MDPIAASVRKAPIGYCVTQVLPDAVQEINVSGYLG